MTCDLSVGGGGIELRIRFLSRSLEDAKTDWDKDAIKVEVKYQTLSINGAFETTIWSHEIFRLQQMIERLQTATDLPVAATFDFREGTVCIEMNIDEKGALTVPVRIAPDPGQNEVHRFTITSIDRTFLPHWKDELSAILQNYPVHVPLVS